MLCDQCGQDIEDDSRFCRKCGALQEVPVEIATAVSPDSASAQYGVPATSPDQTLWIVAGAFGVFLLVVIAAVSLSGPPQAGLASSETAAEIEISADAASDAAVDAAAAASEAAMAAANAAGEASGPGTGSGPWSYSTEEDKLRGQKTYLARTTSVNSIYQASPYDGATTMDMTIRESSAHGTDVILTITQGQMMCPSYDGCSAAVRFDENAPETISFNGPSDNSSEVIFVSNAKPFIAKLKKSKRVMIEKTLYQAGNPQFEFNVSGLKWDH